MLEEQGHIGKKIASLTPVLFLSVGSSVLVTHLLK
jgi:hypothetical protein